MTFSIVARENRTFAVAVASGSVAVGDRVPWAERGVGAIATQGLTDISYGIRGLELLRKGLKPEECLNKLLAADPGREMRQVFVLGMGGCAAHSGRRCSAVSGHVIGENFICGGNLLRSSQVIVRMAQAFRRGGSLPNRLLAALKAGAEAGGDRRGERSAAILIAGERFTKVQVDDSEDPISELERKLGV